MKISFKQALKAPFAWTVLLVAALSAIPAILISYYGIDTTGRTLPMPTQPVMTVAIISLVCMLLITGYSILFAHNRMNNIEPTFPALSWKLIKTALKNIVFGLGTYVPMLILAAIVLVLTSAPNYIAVPISFIAIVLCVYYIIVATARFMDTLLMRTPFQVTKNIHVMKQCWKSFLVLIAYNILALIVLGIPAVLFGALVLRTLFLMFPTLEVLIGITFVQALLRTYIVFVCLHIFAQGYAWIKENMKNTEKTITVKPVSVTVAKATKPVAKKAPAKAPVKKVAPVKKAVVPAKKVTVKAPVKKATAKTVAPKTAVKKTAVKKAVKKK